MKYAIVLVAATLLVACNRNDGKTPLQSALTRGTDALDDSVQDGRRAANTAGPFVLEVRYNPAPCGCPPHEVYARGSWRRVFVNEPSGRRTLAPLQGDDPLATLEVRGEFTEERKTGDDGIAYPVFAIR